MSQNFVIVPHSDRPMLVILTAETTSMTKPFPQTAPTPMVSAASTPIAAIEVAPRAAAAFPTAAASAPALPATATAAAAAKEASPPFSPPPDFSDLVIFYD